MKTHLRKRWNVRCEPKMFSGLRRPEGGACFLTGGKGGIELPVVKVKGFWTAFQAFLATVGRLVSLTFVVWQVGSEG